MQTVLIAGGTGLVGLHLSRLLRKQGYQVFHLSRKKNLQATFPAYQWDISKKFIDIEAIQKANYVINLAGAGIADKHWTKARKKLIINSRVDSTLLLKSYLEKKVNPLKAYISASAIGYYGNRGEQVLYEKDNAGTQGFLPESVVAWEKAIGAFTNTSTRTVGLRIGIVLSVQGGALAKILLPFKLFNGTYFGNGQQWYSWIHIEDVSRMFLMSIENENMQGFYNAVAPNPVRNKVLVEGVKAALNKPALILPAPAFALRLAMGEMADMILDSTNVASEKIEKAGFQFKFPQLVPAVRDLLQRKI